MNLPLNIPPRHICLLRLSAIGDVTHVLPALHILQHAWPQTQISWIIGKTEAGLVQDIKGVEFIIFDKAKGIKAFGDLQKKLHGHNFDLLLNMQVSPRAALASLLINAPIKIGYDHKRGKLLHNLVCNTHIPHKPRQHVLDSFLEFPKLLGLDTTELSWEIPIPQNAKKAIHLRLGEIGPYMIINPCTSNRARNWRNWSAERYASIIDHAQTTYGLKTILSGGPSPQELNYAEQISSFCTHKPHNLVGQTKLKELAALCRDAKIMIAPDTGPAHIANAMGTPVIGLYASSNPDRTGPYGQQELTVNAYPEALRREFNKTATEVKWGQRVRNPQIMELIEVEQVLGKMRQCLQPRHKATSHKY